MSRLVVLFLLSLPFVNPYIHGDGVGYYAYARAPLIQGNLRFEEDWRRANRYFATSRTLPDGQLSPHQYTETGYVNNLFAVGPAILWSPFLVVTHLGVIGLNQLGSAIPADGFSRPYRLAMAFGTAVYGFLGLLFSFLVARKYTDEHSAFLATLGIWTASSLPVYMYFNPSWSHAHSAFVVALFLWFWDRTRPERSLGQWLLLGVLGGLMVNTYFPNGVVMSVVAVESLRRCAGFLGHGGKAGLGRHLAGNVAFLAAFSVALAPTLITRIIIFGGPFRLGSYGSQPWDWSAPHWWDVLFSSNHGLLSWTPLLALAFAGLFLASRSAREIAAYYILAAASFYYVIASYPYWHGASSFGNRFFISLTPVFVLGLSLFFHRLGQRFAAPRAAQTAWACLLGAFAVWNAGFIFQWGTQMISPRGAVSFGEVARNQVTAVPARLGRSLQAYFLRRGDLMQEIEHVDMERQGMMRGEAR